MDETGLMLQPLVRRTWAPVGQTPVLDCWDRHDRRSVLGGLSLAPGRNRLGLYFSIHGRNVTAVEFELFLRAVQQQLRRPLTVVLDRWSVHRKAARMLQADRRFRFEWLPPYAPELNPVERVWGHTKCADLANYVADDIGEVECAAEGSLQETQRKPELLRSFFHAAKLGL